MPFDSTPYCSPSAYDAASPLFHEVVAAFQSLNITVEQVHKKIHAIIASYICMMKLSLGIILVGYLMGALYHPFFYYLLLFYATFKGLISDMHP